MKIKTKFMTTALVTGLTIFNSTVSYATQTCLEMPGELHLISIGFGENSLPQEDRIRLDAKARITCSEAAFCIENASIKTTYFVHPWTGIGHGTMTAVANCLK